MVDRATSSDIPLIAEAIDRFGLDGEDLAPEQFVVVRRGGRVAAFGRIKPYEGVYELGSVGVLDEERGRGLGTRIVDELIRRFPTPDVHLVTDVPAFFERFGFERVEQGPTEIEAKIERVCGGGGVVAMVLQRESAEIGSPEGQALATALP